MANAALPGDHDVAQSTVTGFGSPPPMPSIAASALQESRRLVDRARRTLASWLAWG